MNAANLINALPVVEYFMINHEFMALRPWDHGSDERTSGSRGLLLGGLPGVRLRAQLSSRSPPPSPPR